MNKIKILETYTNEKDGLKAEIFKNSDDRLFIIFRDIDAQETVGSLRYPIPKTIDEARQQMEKAKFEAKRFIGD